MVPPPHRYGHMDNGKAHPWDEALIFRENAGPGPVKVSDIKLVI